MNTLYIYTDGGGRNPGPSACAFVLENHIDCQSCYCGFYLGCATNNTSEYFALVEALQYIIHYPYILRDIETIIVRSDSELLVKQLKGEYKVKNDKIRNLFVIINKLLSRLASYNIIIEHIPREKNKKADRIVRETLELYGPNKNTNNS